MAQKEVKQLVALVELENYILRVTFYNSSSGELTPLEEQAPLPKFLGFSPHDRLGNRSEARNKKKPSLDFSDSRTWPDEASTGLTTLI